MIDIFSFICGAFGLLFAETLVIGIIYKKEIFLNTLNYILIPILYPKLTIWCLKNKINIYKDTIEKICNMPSSKFNEFIELCPKKYKKAILRIKEKGKM